MKNSIKISIITLLALLGIMFGHISNAQIIDVTSISVDDIQNGHATVSWVTTTDTRGIVYFGDQQNSMNFYVAHNAYTQFHTAELTGLKENTVYYFKILAYDAMGNINEAYIQNFETDEMIDTSAPTISDLVLLQKTDDAIAISWTTNEKTVSRVQYGLAEDTYTKSKSNSGYRTEHIQYIYGLEPNTWYYLRITVTDKAKNQSQRLMRVQTTSLMDPKILYADNIKPLAINDALVKPEQVTISWRSPFVAKSTLYVVNNKTRASKRYVVSDTPKINHEYTISELDSNATYSYYIEMNNGLYNLKFKSNQLSFTTKPLSAEYVRGLYQIGDLVKSKSNRSVYLLRNGNKILFTKDDFDRIGYDPARVKTIPEEHLSYFDTQDSLYQVYQNEELVKLAGDPSVYLISNGVRRAFFNGTAFTRLGYNWMDIKVININDLMKLPRGENIY